MMIFLILLAWILSGCVGAVPPQPLAVHYDEKTQHGIDMSLLRSFLEEHAEEEELFTFYPLAEPEKKEIAQVEEKKEIQKGVASLPEEPLTALQEAPGPTADDRLLDIWKKDIDRAMQNPPGQRKIEFSIPLVENNRVRYFVNFFSGRLRGFFERALARSGRYVPMMTTILREEGLPEDLVFLSLIESGFSPYAYSKAKAMGPWQFIRGTGLRYGLKINGWVDERRDPIKSTRAAAAYLKDLHLQFGEWFLAAAAYNAGERKVEKAIHRSRTNDFWHLSQKTHLKMETRNYVPKFIAATLIASTPEKYGFGDVVYEPPIEYDEVSIKKPLRLQTIADLANTTVEAIRELNPALLRNSTPPSENGFMLRVPAGRGETFFQAYELLPDSATVKVITHKVRKGETLVAIAKKYRQPVSQVMELNNLKSRRVQVGQELIIMPDGAPKKR